MPPEFLERGKDKLKHLWRNIQRDRIHPYRQRVRELKADLGSLEIGNEGAKQREGELVLQVWFAFLLVDLLTLNHL
jgi:hypothetical protein